MLSCFCSKGFLTPYAIFNGSITASPPRFILQIKINLITKMSSRHHYSSRKRSRSRSDSRERRRKHESKRDNYDRPDYRRGRDDRKDDHRSRKDDRNKD